MLTLFSNLRSLFSNKVSGVLLIAFMGVFHFHAPMAYGMLITSAQEKPGVGYYKAVLERLYNWYGKQYFPFEKHLSAIEQELVHSVIADIDKNSQYLDPRTHLPRFRLSMELEVDKVHYGNLWLSFPQTQPALNEMKKQIEAVLKQRGVPMEGILATVPMGTSRGRDSTSGEGELYGLEWSFQNEDMSLFYLVNNRLVQKTYRKKKYQETYIWTRLEHIEAEGSEIFAVGISEVWEVKSDKKKKKYIGTSMFPSKEFNEAIKSPMVSLAREFGLKPQYILLQDQAHLRIFYQ